MDSPSDTPPKRVAILGSTGSIGTQTVDVAAWRGHDVVGLAAGRNAKVLIEQARRLRPEIVSCDASIAAAVRPHLPAGTRLRTDVEGAEAVAAHPADVVVAAIPGMAGLRPTLAALREGRHVALANKEAMVVAGPLVWREARRYAARITPVDSEHSALYQCLVGEPAEAVAELILTASGGPFRDGPSDLSGVTPEQALAHPTWSMGPKVTIDSSTLFNKGLEVLEAHYLFELPLDRIDVVVHRQSIVHSLVRFRDGNLKAQVGPHDMRIPIHYALEAPARPPIPLEPFPVRGRWDFEAPDRDRFPALDLAYRAGRLGGTAPTVLNAADEIAVEAFVAGRIGYLDIPRVLERCLDAVERGTLASSGGDPGATGVLELDALEAADRAARAVAREACED